MTRLVPAILILWAVSVLVLLPRLVSDVRAVWA